MDYFVAKLEENCKTYANKNALSNGGKDVFSYTHVWEISGRVYHYLADKNIGREDAVMINLPRGAAIIEVCIGVWRAGASFVICEAGYSKERTDFIYNDCNCVLKIDEKVLEEMLRVTSIEGYKITQPHDAAYICYTSGSTGKPKGVLHEYGVLEQNIYCHIHDGKYDTDSEDIYALLSPLNFVAGMIVFPSVLYSGGTVVVVPTSIVRNSSLLETFFRQEKITVSFFTASLLKIFNTVNSELRLIYMGSEPVNNIYLENIEMYNIHAQTETGFLTTIFKIDKSYENTPIGKSNIPNLNVKICDESSKEVEDGEIGEICFDNIYFRGYINQKEMTEEVFRDGIYHSGDIGKKTEDGNIILLGRADDMVKINGNRVEPREIEEVVKNVLGVGWCFVKCIEHEGTKHIVAYINEAPKIVLGQAREIIELKLPYYMIPSHYVMVDEIPINENGKLARNKLPEPDFNSVAAYAPPRDEIERKLLSIIEKVLGKKNVGIDADFFELGGDSILSMEVVSAVDINDFATEDLFRERTVRKMAEYIRKTTSYREENERYIKVKKYAMEGCRLTAYQQFFFDRQCLTPKSRISTMLNLPIMLKFKDIDSMRLCKAVEEAICSHPMLLSKLVFNSDDEMIQIYDESLYEKIESERITREEFNKKVEDIVVPFKLLNSRLYNIKIYEVDEEVYLFIDVHHIISDGTSLHILLSDIMKAYEGEHLKKDYIYGYLMRTQMRKDDSYYNECRNYLTSAYDGEEWSKCPKRDREPETYTPGYMEKELVFDDIKFDEIKRKSQIGENAIFIMTTLITLAEYNNTDKVKITWTYHGRDNSLKRNMFGLLIKDLVIALRLDEKMTYMDALLSIQKQIASGIAHSLYPYSLLNDVTYEEDSLCFLYQSELYDFTGGTRFDVQSVSLPRKNLTAENSFSVQIITKGDIYYIGINYLKECYKIDSIRKFAQYFEKCFNSFIEDADGDI